MSKKEQDQKSKKTNPKSKPSEKQSSNGTVKVLEVLKGALKNPKTRKLTIAGMAFIAIISVSLVFHAISATRNFFAELKYRPDHGVYCAERSGSELDREIFDAKRSMESICLDFRGQEIDLIGYETSETHTITASVKRKETNYIASPNYKVDFIIRKIDKDNIELIIKTGGFSGAKEERLALSRGVTPTTKVRTCKAHSGSWYDSQCFKSQEDLDDYKKQQEEEAAKEKAKKAAEAEAAKAKEEAEKAECEKTQGTWKYSRCVSKEEMEKEAREAAAKAEADRKAKEAEAAKARENIPEGEVSTGVAACKRVSPVALKDTDYSNGYYSGTDYEWMFVFQPSLGKNVVCRYNWQSGTAVITSTNL